MQRYYCNWCQQWPPDFGAQREHGFWSRLREHAHTVIRKLDNLFWKYGSGIGCLESSIKLHSAPPAIQYQIVSGSSIEQNWNVQRKLCFLVKLPSIQLSSRAVKDTPLQFPLPKQRFMSCSDSYGASWEVPNRSLMKCHHYVIASRRWTMI